jgi:uncharacterized protein YndB with AHSA1/START domain
VSARPGKAGADDYAREIAINAPAERTFDAIATLDGVRGWWTPLASGTDGPGGTIRLEFEGLDEHIDLYVASRRRPVEVAWLVREHTSLGEWAGTTLRFMLDPRGETRCNVAFRHEGLSPTLACYDDCDAGWDHFLGSLVALVEHGKGEPFGARRTRP